MDMALDSSIISPPKFINGSKSLSFLHYNSRLRLPTTTFPQDSSEFRSFWSKRNDFYVAKERLRTMGKTLSGENGNLGLNFEFLRGILKSGIVLVAMVCGVLVYGCKRAFAT
ncbi:hypothetical protein L484_006420 [Morus notabilis]|uniref:Uncharacterized protein n=1 Tax=Morus notabilis TaxID=981085 RepID=W9RMS4_9ROSA|nr:hypothetical protein L484_006420 [Morus notabilis]